MFIVYRLISVDVILRFMSNIVESKAENYDKQFIVKLRQSLNKYSILKMVRFFLRSVYYNFFFFFFHDNCDLCIYSVYNLCIIMTLCATQTYMSHDITKPIK